MVLAYSFLNSVRYSKYCGTGFFFKYPAKVSWAHTHQRSQGFNIVFTGKIIDQVVLHFMYLWVNMISVIKVNALLLMLPLLL